MKLNKRITVMATLIVIGSGGAAFANPTIQSQIASLLPIPTLPTITLPSINLSSLSALLNTQLNKILGKDASQIVDGRGNLDPFKALDAGAGDKAVTETIAKQYGLSSENADRIIAEVQSSESINAQAQSADNSLDASKQISAGIKNLMKQTADNTFTNKTLVSVTASNQKLLTEARDKAREEQTQSYLLNQASKPFFLFSK